VVRGWGASEWERSLGRGEGETRKRWLSAGIRDDGWTCVQWRMTDGLGLLGLGVGTDSGREAVMALFLAARPT